MITCHARCRHRAGDGCALDQAGQIVLLGATGLCELKEDPQGQTNPLPENCSYTRCEHTASDFCRICSIALCEQHRYLFNGQALCLTHFLAYGPDLSVEYGDDHGSHGAPRG